MNRIQKKYGIIAFICGVVIIAGYFLFPVIQMKGNLWNESFANMLESAGASDVKHIPAWRFLTSIFQSTEPEYYDSIALFYGFDNSNELILLYILPLLGGFGMMITGFAGVGIGMIVSGTICCASYFFEIATFPESLSYTYGFSFWQILLIITSILGIIVGVLVFSSEKKTKDTAPAHNDSINHTDRVKEEKRGTLIGRSGEYKDAEVPVQPGETIIIGRDAAVCNLVLQDHVISRIHCYIQFDESRGDYIVKDVSRYGVFDDSGKQIESNTDVRIKPGHSIQIGKTNEVFSLM